MYIDYAIIDPDINEKQAKIDIRRAINSGANGITVPYYLLKGCSYLVDKETHDYSCFIDFPLGMSDGLTRKTAVQQAIKNGANTIDICMPQNLAGNRKYDKIREDVNLVKDICHEDKIKIRYILEYRRFDHRCLKKICEIFDDNDIQFAFPSTGFFIDELSDNILASVFLHQNSKDINVISCGNFWLEKHFEIMIKSGMYGLRTFSPNIIENFALFLQKKSKGK